MLKAKGKFIDTTPIRSLLSQEEAWADSITIEVDRYYGGRDLAEHLFVLRGVTPSGGEAEAALRREVLEDVIRLTWDVSPQFTAEAGTLLLDLAAYRYEDGSDPTADAPDSLLRYRLPAIEVRGLPDSDHTLDAQSYTAFLLNVRETAERALQQISDMIDELHETDPAIVLLTQSQYDALAVKDEHTLYVIRA